MSVKY